MRAFVMATCLLASVGAPLMAADEVADGGLLERRLRACLISGAAGAPRDSLTSAVVAVRSLCYTQIRRVRDFRLDEVERGFGLPAARLTAEQQSNLERARDSATRQLNDEVARAISNFTGLTQ